MGIVRKIVFSFIVLLSLNLSSQTAYDTIFFSGKKFIEHVVKGGESLRSIAVLHKVTTSEIKVANELKVIISNNNDFEWALSQQKNVNADCKLYLQPEWSKREFILPKIIDFVTLNPQWIISLQTHKYMNIP